MRNEIIEVGDIIRIGDNARARYRVVSIDKIGYMTELTAYGDTGKPVRKGDIRKIRIGLGGGARVETKGPAINNGLEDTRDYLKAITGDTK